MNSNIDYKNKALKYKAKYLELKKQIAKLNIKGGTIPEWYERFEYDLNQIFRALNNNYPNVVLTGSGAIVYLLKNLEMYDELNTYIPNDLDFLYKSRTPAKNKSIILNYKIKAGQENESSVTYNLMTGDNFIRSFDISIIPDVNSFNLNGIEIINLNRLKSDYRPDLMTPEERIEKDKYKIELINKIITKISSEGRFDDFGLGDNITRRKSNKNPKRLFGDDDDDEIDFKPNTKYKSMFGATDDADDISFTPKRDLRSSNKSNYNSIFGATDDTGDDTKDNNDFTPKRNLFEDDTRDNNDFTPKRNLFEDDEDNNGFTPKRNFTPKRDFISRLDP